MASNSRYGSKLEFHAVFADYLEELSTRDAAVDIEISRLVYILWLHCSKLKHDGEALESHAKELILDTYITEENERGQDALNCLYNP